MCAQSYPFGCFRTEEPSGVVWMEARRPPIDNIIRKDSEWRTKTELLDVECDSSFHTFTSHFCCPVGCFCKEGVAGVCVVNTLSTHTPTTHFMFVSFHDAIRILAYPWLCANNLCPLVFCVVFVPQMYAMSHYTVVCLSSPAHIVSARRFAFALCFSYCVSIRSIAFACRLCVVARGSSPHHRLSFLLSSVLCLCTSLPLGALPLHFFASSSPLVAFPLL